MSILRNLIWPTVGKRHLPTVHTHHQQTSLHLKFDMASVDNMPYFIYNNRWTAENRANAKWPRANRTSTRSMRASDRYIEDGSYLRCKNVSLSYRFRHPMKFVESINLEPKPNAINIFLNFIVIII